MGELSLLTILISPTRGTLRLGWDTRALGALLLQPHRCAGKVRRLLQIWLKSSGYLDYELVKTSLGGGCNPTFTNIVTGDQI